MPEEPRLLHGCSTVSVIPSCTVTCLCREIWPQPLLKIDEPELGTWVSGVWAWRRVTSSKSPCVWAKLLKDPLHWVVNSGLAFHLWRPLCKTGNGWNQIIQGIDRKIRQEDMSQLPWCRKGTRASMSSGEVLRVLGGRGQRCLWRVICWGKLFWGHATL